MTTANKITILRISLIPFFAIELIRYVCSGSEMHQMLATVSFAIISVLDGVDGFIARRFNQKSELGAILDPLADKLLLVVGIAILSFYHETFLVQIPPWFAGLITGCNLLLLAGFAGIRITIGKVIVRPLFIGKISSGLQIIVMLWILLKWNRNLDVRWFTLCISSAAACMMLSVLFYTWDGVKQLRSHTLNGKQ